MEIVILNHKFNQFCCRDRHLNSQIKCLTHIHVYNTGIFSSCVHPSKLCTIDECSVYLNCPLYRTQKYLVLIYSTFKIDCVARMVVIYHESVSNRSYKSTVHIYSCRMYLKVCNLHEGYKKEYMINTVIKKTIQTGKYQPKMRGNNLAPMLNTHCTTMLMHPF